MPSVNIGLCQCDFHQVDTCGNVNRLLMNNGKCYKPSCASQLSWKDAENSCIKLLHIGHLASVHSSAENTQIWVSMIYPVVQIEVHTILR